VILLAIDTCDGRGSVAVLRDEAALAVRVHETAEDYSSWLLPAVQGVLGAAKLGMKDVDVYAVASGPGSFTGLRVGLTTVKAWSEVYGRPIVAVSRLYALAGQGNGDAEYLAAIVDAQRDQVFAALYRREGGGLQRVEDEAVIAPEKFLDWVRERVGSEKVVWVVPDEDRILTQTEGWASRQKAGDVVERVGAVLAPIIGKIGYEMARGDRLTDALTLDANYVRRSDAEIFWKGGAGSGRG
jgi:tRNA threonylcarbamoyladenosine biosynthesis protein TsaB